MGSYADAEHVETRLANWRNMTTPFTTLTEPTLDEVNAFISQVEGEINGILTAQGYSTVPATGSNDVQLLRLYTANETAYNVWGVRFGHANIPEVIKEWHEGYKAFINRLRQGQQHLVDQLPQSESDGAFLIVRHPVRDDYFSYRNTESEWDE